MSETGITIGLVLVAAVFGWLIYRVVSTLGAGSSSPKAADYAALGAESAGNPSDTHDPARGHNEYVDRARKHWWTKSM